MRILVHRFETLDASDLERFAERTVRETCPLCGGASVAERLNGRAVGRCALCKGVGSVRVEQIACDDCGQFHPVADLDTWHVGPFEEDPKDHIWAVLCGICLDLTREAFREMLRREA
jgi:formate dehydrogenase maturation protein FdhE